jgi:arylsulfatase
MMNNIRSALMNTVITGSLFFVGTLAFFSCSQFDKEINDKPNIVLIMADDMGFSDIGCYGGEIATPNLDRLAEEGLRFTQFYNNSICVPTRASLLTGLYPQQVGVYKNSMRVYENCVTLAEVLRTAGYRTLMTGKWHALEIPVERGFDRYFGLCDGCCNFFNPGPRRPGEPEPGRKLTSYGYPRRWAIDDTVYQPYAPKDKNFYTTDAFTDYAIDYLDQYGNEDKPFFLYLAYTAPHFPLHAWPEDIKKYQGKYMIGWDELRKQRFKRISDMKLFSKPISMSLRDEEVPKWDDIENKEEWDLKMAVYAAMIDRMDQNIGRVLDKIRDLGKEENTLIIFLSDNGGCAGDANYTPDIPPGPVESYRSVDAPWANASNTPFRKYKVWDHEGGICTPFIAYWPKFIKNKGSITDQTGHLIDIMATLVDVSGAKYPASYEKRKIPPMEGKSLRMIFEGKKRADHEALFWQSRRHGHRAVRSGKWKLVSPDDKSPWELYNIEKDRTEMRNLAKALPDKAKELEDLYHEWATKVGINGQPQQ